MMMLFLSVPKYSMMLYQNLLKDKWKLTNVDYLGIDYSTRQLKMMFGLSKDDYVKMGILIGQHLKIVLLILQ